MSGKATLKICTRLQSQKKIKQDIPEVEADGDSFRADNWRASAWLAGWGGEPISGLVPTKGTTFRFA